MCQLFKIILLKYGRFYLVLLIISLCSCTSINQNINKFNAESLGNATAQYNMGCAYLFGTGVDIDYKEAMKWFIKSARQEHAGALNNLGYMYENGLGIKKDFFEAINFYKIASSKEEKWLNEANKINAGIRKGKDNYERLRKVIVTIPTYDNLIIANYPKYRIDDNINVVCLILDTENKSYYESGINNLLILHPNIRLINPENISSIIGSKILEYGTGLTREQSIQLSKLLQVDHIIYISERISPHSDYKFGGRAYIQLDLKIISSIDGEIVFKATGNFGIYYIDPRPYGYSFRSEIDDSTKNHIRSLCWDKYIKFPLMYALGDAADGYSVYLNSTIIDSIAINSPADKSGMKTGDVIMDIEGFKIDNFSDFNRYYLSHGLDSPKKQGDIRIIRVKRGSEIIECKIEFPIIPKILRDENNNNNIKSKPNDKKYYSY